MAVAHSFFRQITIGFIALCANYAMAGSISLQTQATISVSPSSTQVKLAVSNLGDETAQQTQLQLLLNLPGLNAPAASDLAPSAQLTHSFMLTPNPFARQGRYFLPLQISYKDAAGYPFSVVQMLEVVNGNKPSSPLRLMTSTWQLPTRTAQKVTLYNQQAMPIKVQLSCWLPMQIRCNTATPTVEIASKGQLDVEFQVEHGELWPTNYQGFVRADGVENAKAWSEVLPLTLEVKPASPLLNQLFQPLTLLLLSGGLVLFVGLRSWRRRRS